MGKRGGFAKVSLNQEVKRQIVKTTMRLCPFAPLCLNSYMITKEKISVIISVDRWLSCYDILCFFHHEDHEEIIKALILIFHFAGSELNTIYPVILAVPYNKKNLSSKDRVAYLSSHARCALEISARKSCIRLGDLLKDKNGAPICCRGNYWSLSHKPSYVAAVVAHAKIGIDIEEIKTCSESLFKKVADPREWGLADGDKFKLFFRYWTAKEAVLKAVGTGLKDLSKCRIARVVDEKSLAIDYMNKKWLVEHFFFNRHIVSVNKGLYDINWSVVGDLASEE